MRPTTHPSRSPRVVYFRVVEPEYPRNRRIRDFLCARGHEVVLVPPAISGPALLRHATDLWRLFRVARPGDVLIVAEQYVRATPIAALVALVRRCELVVDAFVGIHETAVEDWQVAAPSSLRARRFRLQDRFALRVADCVLIDTDVRAARVRQSTSRTLPVISLPVGAPVWATPRERDHSGSPALRVLYYGNYVPLHGLDLVLRAIAATQRDVRLVLVGHGTRRPSFERQARALGLGDAVEFRPSVAETELADLIAEHDVVLGVFGRSRKASTVIANKTWQGLACGRTVVTRRSPALDELRPLVGDFLVEVDVDDALPLAQALDDLAANVVRLRRGNCDDQVAERLEQYVRHRFETFGTWLDTPAAAS
jgi:glycosyltransferase involved in cell wall biosynthesis